LAPSTFFGETAYLIPYQGTTLIQNYYYGKTNAQWCDAS
jgi:hypothetical protein